MELYQLESFVAVAEEGNMTRAASRLNLSQPAVSAQIRALEDELGMSLFRRSAKGMELTPEGERLMDKAGNVLRGMDELRGEAETLRSGGVGTVTLGVNTDPRLLRLKAIHTMLAETSPRLSLVVKETMSWEVADELRAGKIDLGFSYLSPKETGIGVQLLGEIALAIVAPKAWREALAKAGEDMLTAFPWVWTSDHCPMNPVLTELFTQSGKDPDKAVVVDQESAILKLVADEVGLGIMPVSKVDEMGTAYGIFPVMTLDRAIPLYLAYLEKRGGEKNPEVLRRVVESVWT